MIRGTTPTITYQISKSFHLQTVKQMWVMIKSQGNMLVKYIDDVVIDKENNIIRLELTQKETLSFRTGEIKTQIKFLTETNRAFATPEKSITLDDILKGGIIE